MSPPIAFFDLETRSAVDIKKHAIMRYACDPSTQIICIALKMPDGRQGVWAAPWALEAFTEEQRRELSDDWIPEAWNAWVEAGGLVVAANASFDRLVLREHGAEIGLAAPRIDQTLCSHAQGESYSLPGSLGAMAAELKVPFQKDPYGAKFIRSYCNAANPWNPTFEELKGFIRYGLYDVLAMEGVWQRCRKWTAQEWQDYHVVERENDRGMMVDVEFAAAATRWADSEMTSLNERLRAVTGDQEITLSHSKRKVEWLASQLEGTDLYNTLFVTRKRKRQTVRTISAGKPVQTALLQRLDDTEDRADTELDEDARARVREFLQILSEGNAVASKKYAKMVDVAHEGRVYHQYKCSPTITGRHASRGIQLDNVIRAKLESGGIVKQEAPALDAMDCILGEGAYGQMTRKHRVRCLEEFYGLPFQQLLGRLIRPCIMAPEGKWVVWGDWSSIEARMLPWLARAEAALTPYREKQCVYSQAAQSIHGRPWREIYDGYKAGDPVATRQRLEGKIATLALGYQGGAGALLNMAAAYGVKLSRARAEEIKERWRNGNRWARRFWDDLDSAAWRAYESPGVVINAGRLRYIRRGRDLWCILPDGRPIVYPEIRATDIYKEAWDEVVTTLTYRKVFQKSCVRGELYGGILTENCLARGTEVLTDSGWKTIECVAVDDLLWDGLRWITHRGVIEKGLQRVESAYGVWMTEDHLVYTEKGWDYGVSAARRGQKRAEVGLPHFQRAALPRRIDAPRRVANGLRLRRRVRDGVVLQGGAIVRMCKAATEALSSYARHVLPPGLRRVALDAGSMSSAIASGVEELRRARDSGVRTLANVRGVLGGYGADLPPGAHSRSARQRRRVHPGKLPLGGMVGARPQQTHQPPYRDTVGSYDGVGGFEAQRSECDHRSGTVEAQLERDRRLVPTYDILDAGPLNRFVVRGSDGPLIVHNCVQGAAASLLRWLMRELDQRGYALIGTTHDEVRIESERPEEDVAALEELMKTGPAWAEGLPLEAEVEWAAFYGK